MQRWSGRSRARRRTSVVSVRRRIEIDRRGTANRRSDSRGARSSCRGSLRRWSPEQFRATLQGYFLPASALGLAGYWAAGLWTPVVTDYYLLSLPTALLAIGLGRAINRRLAADRFLVYIHAGLIASGVALLVQALLDT